MSDLVEELQQRMERLPNDCIEYRLFKRCIAALFAAEQRAEAMGRWLPIASAPRDSTRILATGGTFSWDAGCFDDEAPCNFVDVVYWSDSDNVFTDGGIERKFMFKPTHWQPLPAAPMTAASGMDNKKVDITTKTR